MILAKVLNKIYKKNGIILEDSSGQKYIVGNPRKDNPITINMPTDYNENLRKVFTLNLNQETIYFVVKISFYKYN